MMSGRSRVVFRSGRRTGAGIRNVPSTERCLVTLLAVMWALSGDAANSGPASHGQPGTPILPNDAGLVCPFEATELQSWFKAGGVENGGAVLPPDSLGFTADDGCNFFKWSARTFLWLTSPVSGHVLTLESPEFFLVSAPDQKGMRTLSRNAQGGTEARPGVNDAAASGSRPFEHAGQPRSRGVVMAQNGSLVYFANHVNDVFAYFLTGVKTGGIAPPENRPHRAPVNLGDLQKIAAFAEGEGARLTNPNTLAIVAKSAWIETTGLDQDSYITIDATVPTFDTTDPSRWTRNGQKRARLALVGMHIVASVRNEPSMVWATFEHVANTPIPTYAYLGVAGQSMVVDPATNLAGTWHFSAKNCTGTFNQPRMRERTGVIEGVNGQTIGPSNTCRINAWGTPSDTAPHAENNTRIVDVNRNTIGKLARDDVRKNYLLVGATWNFSFGARVLANTTLETFTQHNTCFDCHVGNLTDGLNRIWKRVKPLR